MHFINIPGQSHAMQLFLANKEYYVLVIPVILMRMRMDRVQVPVYMDMHEIMALKKFVVR